MGELDFDADMPCTRCGGDIAAGPSGLCADCQSRAADAAPVSTKTVAVYGDAIAGLSELSMPERSELAAAALASLSWPVACWAIGKAAGRVDLRSELFGGLDRRELATVLAALRYWQREGEHSEGHEHGIASDDYSFAPLSKDEIDALCDRLNP